MMTTTRSELLETLARLGELFPSMRLGQLLCMVCSTAGEPDLLEVDEPEDDMVLAAAQDLVRERAARLDGEGTDNLTELPPLRAELVQALENIGSQYPEWSLGQLAFHLAAWAHLNIYDAEDEQLLEVARHGDPGLQWFRRYTDEWRPVSTTRKRVWGPTPSYRCPCCRHCTLYQRGGFALCPVCYWEDDGQDDEDANAVRGGPNGMLSLTQARQNYAKHGVFDPKFTGHVRPPLPTEM